jgi:hypothetical protein
MSDEPESLVLQMLRQMRAEMGDIRADMPTRSDIAELKEEITEVKSDVRSVRADVASDMIVTRKEMTEQVAGLRRAVMEYHTSVIGHGIVISELEARVRRVEQHLNLQSHDQR